MQFIYEHIVDGDKTIIAGEGPEINEAEENRHEWHNTITRTSE